MIQPRAQLAICSKTLPRNSSNRPRPHRGKNSHQQRIPDRRGRKLRLRQTLAQGYSFQNCLRKLRSYRVSSYRRKTGHVRIIIPVAKQATTSQSALLMIQRIWVRRLVALPIISTRVFLVRNLPLFFLFFYYYFPLLLDPLIHLAKSNLS